MPQSLTPTQRDTLAAIIAGRFTRGPHHGSTLKVLEGHGLIFWDFRRAMATRRGRRFLLAEAEAQARASGAIVGRAS